MRKTIFFFGSYMSWWILTEHIVVIIPQYIHMSSLCCYFPYTVVYVNYASIKWRGGNTIDLNQNVPIRKESMWFLRIEMSS